MSETAVVRPSSTHRTARLSRGWPTTILAKYLMAITGTIFALFVLVHMIGNLKVYSGPEHFNDYAHWLRTLLEPLAPYESVLWVLRAVLLLSLVLHVWCAFLLARRARIARGPHRRRGLRGFTSFTARTMLVTGIVLLLFVVFHILDLTLGAAVAPSGFQATTSSDSFAYENLVASFQRPAASIVYIVAMVCLFAHLAHGLWVAVNDFGVTVRDRARSWIILGAGVFGLLVMLGNISIPIAVMTGIVG